MRIELKRFERGAEISRKINDGMVKLAFFDVDLKNSELIHKVDEFSEESFNDNFIIKSGDWYVENGWVVGKNPEMCPGMIVSKKDFFGHVMVEITAKMVSPDRKSVV